MSAEEQLINLIPVAVAAGIATNVTKNIGPKKCHCKPIKLR